MQYPMRRQGEIMRATNQIPRLAACVATTVAIVLAGCGGSSSSGLSKAQLAYKADAACTAYNNAATKIPPPSDLPANPVTAAAYFDKLKPLSVAFENTMLSLKPDSSAKPLWDRFVAAGQHVTALTDDADTKAHANNRAGLAQIGQAVSTYMQSTLTPIANKLGATVCAA
jgi:hypothetical protein